MKKLITISLVLILIVTTVGCQRKAEIPLEATITLEEHNEIIKTLQEDYELKLKENIKTLQEDYELKLKENRVVPIELPRFTSEGYLVGEFHYNEDKDIYAYIDELGFEVVGNVKLFDPNTGVITPLTFFDYNGQQQTVKKLAWYSENQLLVIIGFSTGTVTVGGNLYVLNSDTKELKLLIETSDMEEIIDIVKPDGGSGTYVFPVAKWDENFMDFDTYNMVYRYEELQELLNSQ